MRKYELPIGWDEARMGDLVEDYIEQGLPEGEREFTYIDISAVDNDFKEIADPKRLLSAKAPSRARQRIKHNDVLISRTRPNLNAVALVPAELDGAIASTGFAVLRPVLLEPFWLYSVVQLEDFVAEMSALVKGTLYPAIQASHVYNYVVPVPPLAEQKRITGKLTKLLKQTRNVIEVLETLPELIQQYRAAVLEAACTGRLVPSESDLTHDGTYDYEPASTLLEQISAERRTKWESNQIAKMQAAGKNPNDDKWKENFQTHVMRPVEGLPQIPSGWMYASMNQLCEIQGGIQKQPKRRARSNHYPFLRVANVQRGSLDLAEVQQIELYEGELETYRLQKGDLLIVEGNGSSSEIGRMAIWADQIPVCVHQNHIIRARPDSGFSSEYGAIYWNSPSGASRVRNVARSTSGLYTLSVGKVGSIPVPVPPFAEQVRIAEEVNRRFLMISNVESQVHAMRKQVDQLRSSFFNDAISGKLVQQNSSDEPASLLLEMIAASKKMQQEARKLEVKKPMKKKSKDLGAKRELLDVLIKNPDGMTPDQLMVESGYTLEEVPAFYKALRRIERHIQETRPERKMVILKRRTV